MTPANFTLEEYDKAYQCANNLRTLFETPPDSYIETSNGPLFISRERWMQILFSFAPDGIYEVLGSMWDGEGRPHIPAYLLSAEEIKTMKEDRGKSQTPPYFNKAAVLQTDEALPPLRTFRSYNNLVNYALERCSGLAILGERSPGKRPDAPISFGAIASYYTFGNHGGTVVMQEFYDNALKIDPNNPLYAKASDENSMMLFDLKENDMIPDFIIKDIDFEIKNYFPDAKPLYKLLYQSGYAMKYILCIILDISKTDQDILLKKISWMMPHYILVCIEKDESIFE